ncbi:Origin recognition complex subunit 2 [Bachmanniomyces sp. S44760]|nr:Origin recognition complex subunit 2 [Bachmanniomyces sp. S44760]
MIAANDDAGDELAINQDQTPSKRGRGRPRKNAPLQINSPLAERTKSIKVAGTRKLFETPTKSRTKDVITSTPSRVQKADRSARKKSAKLYIDRALDIAIDGGQDHDTEDELARQIWESDGGDEEEDEEEENRQDEAAENGLDNENPLLETPSKRGRGRPKGSRNKRTPTPPSNLPPYERYFFQNRKSNLQTSSNTIPSSATLTHSDYHDLITKHRDPHESSISFLHSLHLRSFPQWAFELSQSFSICLYGYGSKRNLITSFATYLHTVNSRPSPPTTIIINGYTPTITVHQILTTILSTMSSSRKGSRVSQIPTQPSDILSLIRTTLEENNPAPIYLLISSIDAPPLRRPAVQSFLSELSTLPHTHLLATADTPSFPLLWDNKLRETFHWIFHDTTTFVSFDDARGTGEVSGVVDAVNELFGKKTGKGMGREAVRWVLKSLPENARGLYRILVAELLALDFLGDGEEDRDGEGEGYGHDVDDDFTMNEGLGTSTRGAGKTTGRRAEDDHPLGIDYRILYQKAVEEFLCSSEMAFRTLLKEFHDHQMVVTRRDETGGVGTELLGVPFGREEMEGILDDLVG